MDVSTIPYHTMISLCACTYYLHTHTSGVHSCSDEFVNQTSSTVTHQNAVLGPAYYEYTYAYHYYLYCTAPCHNWNIYLWSFIWLHHYSCFINSDFSTEVASFHYQSSRYDAFKPPAFGKYPHVQDVHRERERLEVPTKSELQERIENIQSEQNLGVASQQQLSIRSRFRRLIRKSKSKAKGTSTNEKDTADDKSKPKSNTATDDRPSGSLPPRRTQSVEFVRNDVLLSNKGARQNRSTGDVYEKAIKSINRKPKPHKKGFKNERLFDHNLYDEDGKPYSSFVVAARKHLQEGGFPEGQPSLFLEEVAHLLSLLSAVAMSTLRNDLEEAESPLIEFTPGAPWPHVDPDAYASGVRKGWERHGNPAFTIVRYLFGVSRTDTSRTLYNAARPFRVIGNVSDAEIEMLQAARGPFAKTALCSMWLQGRFHQTVRFLLFLPIARSLQHLYVWGRNVKNHFIYSDWRNHSIPGKSQLVFSLHFMLEFISREYMSGSTGKVAPPIISRLYQFTSDGMSAYNQGKEKYVSAKIAPQFLRKYPLNSTHIMFCYHMYP